MQGGGGQQNSSAGLDMVYYAAAIVLGSLLVWNYFSGYIVAVVYRIAYYEGVAMIFPLNFINEELAVLFPGYRPISFFSGMDLLEAMTLMVQDFSLEEAKQVPFDEFASTLGVVGRYLLAYTAPLWVAMSVFLFTHAVDSRYKTKYTMEDFRQLESFNWPAISTMLSKNYSTTPLDDGPFAMSLQPMGFAKKYQLLTEKEVDGKTIAVVDRDKAYTLFCCQIIMSMSLVLLRE